MLETARRIWCRLVFVALCLVPTTLVGGWALGIQTPLYREYFRARWQAELSRRLGVSVRVATARRGPGGRVQLHDLRIVDPEFGRTQAECRYVLLRPGSGSWAVALHGLRVEQSDLRQLVATLNEFGLRRWDSTWPRITWQATDTTLAADVGGATFSHIAGGVESTEDGPQLVLDLTLANGDPNVPVRLSVLRERRVEPIRSRWRFETFGQSLPVVLLGDAVPELQVLGDRCEFSGDIEWLVGTERSSGTLRGRFAQLDLDRWTERLPHKLSGMADLEIRQARWLDGRLAEARGALASRSGVISRSLLVTAGDEAALGMVVADRVRKSTDSLWRYQQLAVEFALADDGLQLSGRCTGHAPGTLLADSRGPLVQDSDRPLVPAVALVRTLAPANEVQVPAGLETDTLLRHLPLPNLVPPTEIADRPKSPKVRLK